MQNIWWPMLCRHKTTRKIKRQLGKQSLYRGKSRLFFSSVALQWKFYVNKMRKAYPRNSLAAFKENYHLSALFRQRLGNSLEPQAPIVLDIV